MGLIFIDRLLYGKVCLGLCMWRVVGEKTEGIIDVEWLSSIYFYTFRVFFYGIRFVVLKLFIIVNDGFGVLRLCIYLGF